MVRQKIKDACYQCCRSWSVCFGPPGSVSESTSQVRILPSSIKNSKKNLDFYRFMTLSLNNDVNVPAFPDPNPCVFGRVVDPWHLVWIRIRGSMPLTNGSGCGSGSCYFVIELQDAEKNKFFKIVFCLLLSESSFTSFSKIKKSKRSHKAVGIKVFITIFAWL